MCAQPLCPHFLLQPALVYIRTSLVERNTKTHLEPIAIPAKVREIPAICVYICYQGVYRNQKDAYLLKPLPQA